jgi:NADH-quinone oxidoreductase subunit L
MTEMQKLYLLVPLAPLFGAIMAGLFGWAIGRRAAHVITILGMVVCLGASVLVFQDVMAGNVFNGPIYTWLASGSIRFEIGFLIDPLSATMMIVVSLQNLEMVPS